MPARSICAAISLPTARGDRRSTVASGSAAFDWKSANAEGRISGSAPECCEPNAPVIAALTRSARSAWGPGTRGLHPLWYRNAEQAEPSGQNPQGERRQRQPAVPHGFIGRFQHRALFVERRERACRVEQETSQHVWARGFASLVYDLPEAEQCQGQRPLSIFGKARARTGVPASNLVGVQSGPAEDRADPRRRVLQ